MRADRPLHEQLSDWLRKQIEQGYFKPNERLPSEHELSKQFGVSRITVRQALQTLEHEGLIYRRQGLGSFVRNARIRQGLVRLTDFAEDMARVGLRARSKVVHWATETATCEVAEALEIAKGSPVVRIERLRLGNDKPVAFDRTWMTLFCAQFLEGHDLEHETIYGILEAAGLTIVRGKYRIEAVNAEPAIARLLEVEPGNALLRIDRIAYPAIGKVAYYQQRYYRSDRVIYELVLERDNRWRIPPTEGMPLRAFAPVFQSQDSTQNS